MKKFDTRRLCTEIQHTLQYCGYLPHSSVRVQVDEDLPTTILGAHQSVETILYVLMKLLSPSPPDSCRDLFITVFKQQEEYILKINLFCRDDKDTEIISNLESEEGKALDSAMKAIQGKIQSTSGEWGREIFIEVPFSLEEEQEPIRLDSVVDAFGNRETAIEAVKCFLTAVQDEFLRLQKSVFEENIEDTHRLAHSIRGGALNIHADKLAKEALKMEKEAKRNNLEKSREQLIYIQREYRKVEEYFNYYCLERKVRT